VFTELLPGNALIKYVTLQYNSEPRAKDNLQCGEKRQKQHIEEFYIERQEEVQQDATI
jgi:hypothetical protein